MSQDNEKRPADKQPEDQADQFMSAMDEKMAQMTERMFSHMMDTMDKVVEQKTQHLGNVVDNLRNAAGSFAANLDQIAPGQAPPPQYPPQQYAPPPPPQQAPPPTYAHPADARTRKAPPVQQDAAPPPAEAPPEQAPAPEQQAPPPPVKKKELPRKSVSEGTSESQTFVRDNKPHLENPVLLKLTDLSKRYDNGVLAVDQLNLEIHEGEIFCMLGANGAGKTSTLMLILSFSEPTTGKIEICGIDVHKDPLAAKTHMAYVSENVMLYGNFTALQNIEFFTRLAGKKATAEEYSNVLKRVGLSEEAHRRKVKSFSKGMRQRSGIAIGIMKDADVILLDEPTSGLDPKGGMEFLRLLDELRAENRGILMTTHDIFRAKEIADRVGIMSAGNLVRVLDREEIEDADLAELYLQYITEDMTHGKIA